MNIRICYGCPLRYTPNPKTESGFPQVRCSILAEKSKSVRGLGLTMIDFDCPTKQSLFKPGQRVSFLVRGERAEYGGHELDEVYGWVLRWKGRKVQVISEETGIPVLKFYPSKLKLTGEERRACIHCAKPEGVEVSVKSKTFGAAEESHPWRCREGRWDESAQAHTWLPCEFPEASR